MLDDTVLGLRDFQAILALVTVSFYQFPVFFKDLLILDGECMFQNE